MSSPRLESSSIVSLDQLTCADHARAGSKAANLGELRRAGFAVPDGVVITGTADIDAQAITAVLGSGPLAVRSSAAAEDLGEASFAGQYETVLDVRGPDALRQAIQTVRDSARGTRTEHYRASRGVSDPGPIAVLVQRMLHPQAAGVAFTADPLSGARDQVVIAAGRGLGDRMVSGEAIGDEWVVRDVAECRRSLESALDAEQALAIARLARGVEAHMGGMPQDIEWAIEDGQLYLLQARPMTALPAAVKWTPPAPGYWLRTFRLGEWLSDPMTPLFQTWLLERLGEGLRASMRDSVGATIRFPEAAINGWYYAMAGLHPRDIPRTFLRAVLQSRGRVVPVLFNALVRVNTRPDLADRALLGKLAEQWRRELLPDYERLVADAERRVEGATPDELIEIVNAVGHCAGGYFWSLAIVGGSAWKMESALGRFLRKHVPGDDGSQVQVLLRGLPGITLGASSHAVPSIDWYWPPIGDASNEADQLPDERRAALAAERLAAEGRYRDRFADRPAVRARFDGLLEVAQRYAVIREEQARWFTLGWPLMRRSVLRLGESLAQAGAIAQPEDVFFLRRAELEQLDADYGSVVQQRRAEWQGQQRLVAPLGIGKPPRILEAALSGVGAPKDRTAQSENVVVGQAASPGHARGRVRVVSGPEDFAAFMAGEVLVARATAPAWTPLFAKAVAVVTDAGTLAAHASLVAREYGIPAVVGTTDATRRLRTGVRVSVDGGAGIVRIED